MNVSKKIVTDFYKRLYRHFGPQYWWPAQTALEVAVGAILTQNTSWTNVERAIANLKKAKSLTFKKMRGLTENKLSKLIRPAGYYNIKARRLKNFIEFVAINYQGSLERMKRKDAKVLRQELLAVNGIGPETADSILLYALQKPVFVIDSYTRRILSRHGMLKEPSDYYDAQKVFTRHLRSDTRLFNEYHALLVRCAKEFCRKQHKGCDACPINEHL